jgi:hypothetical protein
MKMVFRVQSSPTHGNNCTKQQADDAWAFPLLQQKILAQENHANMN